MFGLRISCKYGLFITQIPGFYFFYGESEKNC